jgi:hypothetical protein
MSELAGEGERMSELASGWVSPRFREALTKRGVR